MTLAGQPEEYLKKLDLDFVIKEFKKRISYKPLENLEKDKLL